MFPHEIPRNFSTDYKCYSVSMMPGQERQDVEQGGKSTTLLFVSLNSLKLSITSADIMSTWAYCQDRPGE